MPFYEYTKCKTKQSKTGNSPLGAFSCYTKIWIFHIGKIILPFTAFTAFLNFWRNSALKWGKYATNFFFQLILFKCSYFHRIEFCVCVCVIYYAHMSCNVYCSNDIEQVVQHIKGGLFNALLLNTHKVAKMPMFLTFYKRIFGIYLSNSVQIEREKLRGNHLILNNFFGASQTKKNLP